jgi:hypothetical protein
MLQRLRVEFAQRKLTHHLGVLNAVYYGLLRARTVKSNVRKRDDGKLTNQPPDTARGEEARNTKKKARGTLRSVRWPRG